MNQIPDKAIVLVNLKANAQNASKRWDKIESYILSCFEYPCEIIRYRPPFDLKGFLETRVAVDQTTCIISAGGDGSLHYLINGLMTLPEVKRKSFIIGAIGLGSSNDALKPFSNTMLGIPFKMNYKNAKPIDIGSVVLENPGKSNCTTYFLSNASIGVTANANLLFNKMDWFIRKTKQKFTNIAILYAAIKSIILHKNRFATFDFNNHKKELELSNTSILKSPYLAGDLRYDQSIQRDDGHLGVNTCIGMNRYELLRTVLQLQKGKFSKLSKRFTSITKEISIYNPHRVATEMDGEVYVAQHFHFSVIPQAINFITH